MVSFKGFLKYLLYFCIAAWMFLLGIIVGRGTSPVTFDTQKFQERLESIAKEYGKTQHKVPPKVDLDFDALKDSTPKKQVSTKKAVKEIVPDTKSNITAVPEVLAEIPVKKSKKTATLNKEAIKKKKTPLPVAEVKKTPLVKKKPAIVSQTDKKTDKKNIKKDNYTIQLAAYKKFTDAVSHMAALEKKGISSYREKGVTQGVTWYRIKTGSFATLEEAKKYKATLERKNIKAFIIKKGKQ